MKQARRFYLSHKLRTVVERDVFIRGALLARDADSLDNVPGLTSVEKSALESEDTESSWRHVQLLTKETRIILATCCIASIAQ